MTGSYAFHAEGQELGLLGSANVLHRFTTPAPFTGVGEYMFDGNGNFTRLDYNTGNGTPAFPPSPIDNDQGFRTVVSGTYSVSTDCTATFTVGYASATQVILAVARVNYGQSAFGTLKSEQVSSFSPVSNTSDLPCASGCYVAAVLTTELVQNSTRRR